MPSDVQVVLIIVSCGSLVLAVLPAVLFLVNLRLYRPPPENAPDAPPIAVSVLIPARNEEHAIAGAVQSVLASRGVELELLVLDDHSEDATAAVVTALSTGDPRVRLLRAAELPTGWCGKQWACWTLGQAATKPVLVFLDADVRVQPTGLARSAEYLRINPVNAALVSGVPAQVTGTWAEALIIPLIHFVLLGFLPVFLMRSRCDPGLGSGCGQLFVAQRSDYLRIGGHGHPLNRLSLHDGIKLPRAFRTEGLMTDLFDATDVATCRMYRSASQVWRGFAKNATEGLAAPALIVPATVLLFGGQVLPFVLLGLAGVGQFVPTVDWMMPITVALSAVAAVLALLPRVIAVFRFRQPVLGAVLHPLGVMGLLAIQWYALLATLVGRSPAWRGRRYSPAPCDATPKTTATG